MSLHFVTNCSLFYDILFRYLAASQLQSVDARKVFPCFDEPDLKANFTVTITHKDRKYQVSGRLHPADCIWEKVSGGLYPVDCIWETVSGRLYLGNCIWETVSGRLYFTDRIRQTASGRLYLADYIRQTLCYH